MYADPILLHRQYANDKNLRIRQEIHARYSVPAVNFPQWVLSRLVWRGDERILDVGCGSGSYYPAIREQLPDARYIGIDIEPGMLENHEARRAASGVCVGAGDALHLPFADSSFDVVMMNHMLHHVANISTALNEARRVLKSDGVLLASTSSAESLHELNARYRRAITLLSSPSKIRNGSLAVPRSSFTLENGAALLGRHFYAVVRHDLPGALVFRDVEPVMRYLSTWRSMREPSLPPNVRWDDVMMVMREQLSRVIAHFGELVISKLTGVLIASDRGGFIHEYVRYLEHDLP
jgi:SAM-dependent methyltransferase